MKKKFLASALGFISTLPVFANEGMWLPFLLNRNYEDMKAHGLQLTPEELYSVNNSSLKDAIISFSGFCTGEIISPNGLILTNHHCGFSTIQAYSTVENDYLSNGFWAKSYSEEKPNEDLFARFLVRIEDVTNRITEELTDEMSEEKRKAKIGEISKTILDEATTGNHYDANVKSFFHGNEFYLFVYETYNDVRLVGTPPSSIGKFGGDTDNWMWPRHTGDFSLFRLYTDPDGMPAEYSKENIPMVPKYYLSISLDGIKEGDFTMVFGYPASTDRYLSSYGVKQAIEKYNPSVVEVREIKLSVMRKYMDKNPATRIQYASKYARTSNYWKYYIGQTEQLKNNNVYSKKLLIEDDFHTWANASAQRTAKYGKALNLLKEAYQESDNYVKGNVYVLEAGLLGAELPLYAFRLSRTMSSYFDLIEEMKQKLDKAKNGEEKKIIKEEYKEKTTAIATTLKKNAKEYFKDYNQDLDKELFAKLMALYHENIDEKQQSKFLQKAAKKYRGNFNKFADKVYNTSFLVSEKRVNDFLEDPNIRDMEKDMAVTIGSQLYALYLSYNNDYQATDDKMRKGYRIFTAGLRKMNPDKIYYSDANGTMRVTYGTVSSYYPKDAVFYDYYTSATGVLQKEDPNNDEFIVPDSLTELIKDNNFGTYTNEKGELPICFVHNTDITGGNSGSPVINGKGQLVGCAFDGNWEAMSGDIYFEDELQRTISVDVRYILFIIDKYAGAKNIIDELTLVKNDMSPAMHEEESMSIEKAPTN